MTTSSFSTPKREESFSAEGCVWPYYPYCLPQEWRGPMAMTTISSFFRKREVVYGHDHYPRPFHKKGLVYDHEPYPPLFHKERGGLWP